jgi:hypothetical protein
LDGVFGLKIEGKKDDKSVCINQKKFEEDSHKEISRYVSDFSYYNNVWRISLLSTLIISLFIVKFVPEKNITYMIYIIVVIFCVIYHSWAWKIHHSYDFILKSVSHACDQRTENKIAKYEPLVHA